eukprot:5779591-Amphidinium_carterae.1
MGRSALQLREGFSTLISTQSLSVFTRSQSTCMSCRLQDTLDIWGFHLCKAPFCSRCNARVFLRVMHVVVVVHVCTSARHSDLCHSLTTPPDRTKH